MKESNSERIEFIKEQIHEINNGLSIISGYKDLIHEKCIEEKINVESDIKYIHNSIDRVRKAADKILEIF